MKSSLQKKQMSNIKGKRGDKEKYTHIYRRMGKNKGEQKQGQEDEEEEESFYCNHQELVQKIEPLSLLKNTMSKREHEKKTNMSGETDIQKGHCAIGKTDEIFEERKDEPLGSFKKKKKKQRSDTHMQEKFTTTDEENLQWNIMSKNISSNNITIKNEQYSNEFSNNKKKNQHESKILNHEENKKEVNSNKKQINNAEDVSATFHGHIKNALIGKHMNEENEFNLKFTNIQDNILEGDKMDTVKCKKRMSQLYKILFNLNHFNKFNNFEGEKEKEKVSSRVPWHLQMSCQNKENIDTNRNKQQNCSITTNVLNHLKSTKHKEKYLPENLNTLKENKDYVVKKNNIHVENVKDIKEEHSKILTNPPGGIAEELEKQKQNTSLNLNHDEKKNSSHLSTNENNFTEEVDVEDPSSQGVAWGVIKKKKRKKKKKTDNGGNTTNKKKWYVSASINAKENKENGQINRNKKDKNRSSPFSGSNESVNTPTKNFIEKNFKNKSNMETNKKEHMNANEIKETCKKEKSVKSENKNKKEKKTDSSTPMHAISNSKPMKAEDINGTEKKGEINATGKFVRDVVKENDGTINAIKKSKCGKGMPFKNDELVSKEASPSLGNNLEDGISHIKKKDLKTEEEKIDSDKSKEIKKSNVKLSSSMNTNKTAKNKTFHHNIENSKTPKRHTLTQLYSLDIVNTVNEVNMSEDGSEKVLNGNDIYSITIEKKNENDKKSGAPSYNEVKEQLPYQPVNSKQKETDSKDAKHDLTISADGPSRVSSKSNSNSHSIYSFQENKLMFSYKKNRMKAPCSENSFCLKKNYSNFMPGKRKYKNGYGNENSRYGYGSYANIDFGEDDVRLLLTYKNNNNIINNFSEKDTNNFIQTRDNNSSDVINDKYVIETKTSANAIENPMENRGSHPNEINYEKKTARKFITSGNYNRNKLSYIKNKYSDNVIPKKMNSSNNIENNFLNYTDRRKNRYENSFSQNYESREDKNQYLLKDGFSKRRYIHDRRGGFNNFYRNKKNYANYRMNFIRNESAGVGLGLGTRMNIEGEVRKNEGEDQEEVVVDRRFTKYPNYSRYSKFPIKYHNAQTVHAFNNYNRDGQMLDVAYFPNNPINYWRNNCADDQIFNYTAATYQLRNRYLSKKLQDEADKDKDEGGEENKKDHQQKKNIDSDCQNIIEKMKEETEESSGNVEKKEKEKKEREKGKEKEKEKKLETAGLRSKHRCLSDVAVNVKTLNPVLNSACISGINDYYFRENDFSYYEGKRNETILHAYPTNEIFYKEKQELNYSDWGKKEYGGKFFNKKEFMRKGYPRNENYQSTLGNYNNYMRSDYSSACDLSHTNDSFKLNWNNVQFNNNNNCSNNNNNNCSSSNNDNNINNNNDNNNINKNNNDNNMNNSSNNNVNNSYHVEREYSDFKNFNIYANGRYSFPYSYLGVNPLYTNTINSDYTKRKICDNGKFNVANSSNNSVGNSVCYGDANFFNLLNFVNGGKMQQLCRNEAYENCNYPNSLKDFQNEYLANCYNYQNYAVPFDIKKKENIIDRKMDLYTYKENYIRNEEKENGKMDTKKTNTLGKNNEVGDNPPSPYFTEKTTGCNELSQNSREAKKEIGIPDKFVKKVETSTKSLSATGATTTAAGNKYYNKMFASKGGIENYDYVNYSKKGSNTKEDNTFSNNNSMNTYKFGFLKNGRNNREPYYKHMYAKKQSLDYKSNYTLLKSGDNNTDISYNNKTMTKNNILSDKYHGKFFRSEKGSVCNIACEHLCSSKERLADKVSLNNGVDLFFCDAPNEQVLETDVDSFNAKRKLQTLELYDLYKNRVFENGCTVNKNNNINSSTNYVNYHNVGNSNNNNVVEGLFHLKNENPLLNTSENVIKFYNYYNALNVSDPFAHNYNAWGNVIPNVFTELTQLNIGMKNAEDIHAVNKMEQMNEKKYGGEIYVGRNNNMPQNKKKNLSKLPWGICACGNVNESVMNEMMRQVFMANGHSTLIESVGQRTKCLERGLKEHIQTGSSTETDKEIEKKNKNETGIEEKMDKEMETKEKKIKRERRTSKGERKGLQSLKKKTRSLDGYIFTSSLKNINDMMLFEVVSNAERFSEHEEMKGINISEKNCLSEEKEHGVKDGFYIEKQTKKYIRKGKYGRINKKTRSMSLNRLNIEKKTNAKEEMIKEKLNQEKKKHREHMNEVTCLNNYEDIKKMQQIQLLHHLFNTKRDHLLPIKSGKNLKETEPIDGENRNETHFSAKDLFLLYYKTEEKLIYLLKQIKPTKDIKMIKQNIFLLLSKMIKHLFNYNHKINVYTVGSTAYDVDSKTSDLDIVIQTNLFNPKYILHSIYNYIKQIKENNNEQFTFFKTVDLYLVDSARVPILTLKIKSIVCDVSINTNNSLKHTEFFISTLKSFPNLRNLMRMIKFWLKVRILPSMKQGGLPTIMWMMLSVYYCKLYKQNCNSDETLEKEKKRDIGREDKVDRVEEKEIGKGLRGVIGVREIKKEEGKEEENRNRDDHGNDSILESDIEEENNALYGNVLRKTKMLSRFPFGSEPSLLFRDFPFNSDCAFIFNKIKDGNLVQTNEYVHRRSYKCWECQFFLQNWKLNHMLNDKNKRKNKNEAIDKKEHINLYKDMNNGTDEEEFDEWNNDTSQIEDADSFFQKCMNNEQLLNMNMEYLNTIHMLHWANGQGQISSIRDDTFLESKMDPYEEEEINKQNVSYDDNNKSDVQEQLENSRCNKSKSEKLHDERIENKDVKIKECETEETRNFNCINEGENKNIYQKKGHKGKEKSVDTRGSRIFRVENDDVKKSVDSEEDFIRTSSKIMSDIFAQTKDGIYIEQREKCCYKHFLNLHKKRAAGDEGGKNEKNEDKEYEGKEYEDKEYENEDENENENENEENKEFFTANCSAASDCTFVPQKKSKKRGLNILREMEKNSRILSKYEQFAEQMNNSLIASNEKEKQSVLGNPEAHIGGVKKDAVVSELNETHLINICPLFYSLMLFFNELNSRKKLLKTINIIDSAKCYKKDVYEVNKKILSSVCHGGVWDELLSVHDPIYSPSYNSYIKETKGKLPNIHWCTNKERHTFDNYIWNTSDVTSNSFFNLKTAAINCLINSKQEKRMDSVDIPHSSKKDTFVVVSNVSEHVGENETMLQTFVSLNKNENDKKEINNKDAFNSQGRQGMEDVLKKERADALHSGYSTEEKRVFNQESITNKEKEKEKTEKYNEIEQTSDLKEEKVVEMEHLRKEEETKHTEEHDKTRKEEIENNRESAHFNNAESQKHVKGDLTEAFFDKNSIGCNTNYIGKNYDDNKRNSLGNNLHICEQGSGNIINVNKVNEMDNVDSFFNCKTHCVRDMSKMEHKKEMDPISHVHNNNINVTNMNGVHEDILFWNGENRWEQNVNAKENVNNYNDKKNNAASFINNISSVMKTATTNINYNSNNTHSNSIHTIMATTNNNNNNSSRSSSSKNFFWHKLSNEHGFKNMYTSTSNIFHKSGDRQYLFKPYKIDRNNYYQCNNLVLPNTAHNMHFNYFNNFNSFHNFNNFHKVINSHNFNNCFPEDYNNKNNPFHFCSIKGGNPFKNVPTSERRYENNTDLVCKVSSATWLIYLYELKRAHFFINYYVYHIYLFIFFKHTFIQWKAQILMEQRNNTMDEHKRITIKAFFKMKKQVLTKTISNLNYCINALFQKNKGDIYTLPYYLKNNQKGYADTKGIEPKEKNGKKHKENETEKINEEKWKHEKEEDMYGLVLIEGKLIFVQLLKICVDKEKFWEEKFLCRRDIRSVIHVKALDVLFVLNEMKGEKRKKKWKDLGGNGREKESEEEKKQMEKEHNIENRKSLKEGYLINIAQENVTEKEKEKQKEIEKEKQKEIEKEKQKEIEKEKQKEIEKEKQKEIEKVKQKEIEKEKQKEIEKEKHRNEVSLFSEYVNSSDFSGTDSSCSDNLDDFSSLNTETVKKAESYTLYKKKKTLNKHCIIDEKSGSGEPDKTNEKVEEHSNVKMKFWNREKTKKKRKRSNFIYNKKNNYIGILLEKNKNKLIPHAENAKKWKMETEMSSKNLEKFTKEGNEKGTEENKGNEKEKKEEKFGGRENENDKEKEREKDKNIQNNECIFLINPCNFVTRLNVKTLYVSHHDLNSELKNTLFYESTQTFTKVETQNSKLTDEHQNKKYYCIRIIPREEIMRYKELLRIMKQAPYYYHNAKKICTFPNIPLQQPTVVCAFCKYKGRFNIESSCFHLSYLESNLQNELKLFLKKLFYCNKQTITPQKMEGDIQEIKKKDTGKSEKEEAGATEVKNLTENAEGDKNKIKIGYEKKNNITEIDIKHNQIVVNEQIERKNIITGECKKCQELLPISHEVVQQEINAFDGNTLQKKKIEEFSNEKYGESEEEKKKETKEENKKVQEKEKVNRNREEKEKERKNIQEKKEQTEKNQEKDTRVKNEIMQQNNVERKTEHEQEPPIKIIFSETIGKEEKKALTINDIYYPLNEGTELTQIGKKKRKKKHGNNNINTNNNTSSNSDVNVYQNKLREKENNMLHNNKHDENRTIITTEKKRLCEHSNEQKTHQLPN